MTFEWVARVRTLASEVNTGSPKGPRLTCCLLPVVLITFWIKARLEGKSQTSQQSFLLLAEHCLGLIWNVLFPFAVLPGWRSPQREALSPRRGPKHICSSAGCCRGTGFKSERAGDKGQETKEIAVLEAQG